MILFEEIFNRAVNLFDDPDIQRAYMTNPVWFAKIMRPHLINGMNMFTNPSTVALLLSTYDSPSGALELFEGDGGDVYTVTTVPAANSVLSCFIGHDVDLLATYDTTTSQVTFSKDIPIGTECSLEWYYAGAYTASFAHIVPNMPLGAVEERIKDILAHCLLLKWAEDNKNFLLDIRNLLTDTDFKLYSPANSVRAKVEWYRGIREDLNDLTGKFSWDVWASGVGGSTIG